VKVAEVLMPSQETHWSPRHGVLLDPFGIRWEINCDAGPAASSRRLRIIHRRESRETQP
jgi:hypothetical protein